LKQKSLTVRNFIDVKEIVCRSALIQSVADNSDDLSDNNVENEENYISGKKNKKTL
jgi:hypothetical protein